MKMGLAMIGLAGIALSSGCTAVQEEGNYADLPPQPAVTGTEAAPTAVVIVLPPDIYKNVPPGPPDSHGATETQLGVIEDYGLYLGASDRELLESRVNDCRFTAHDSCTIQAAEPPPAKG